MNPYTFYVKTPADVKSLLAKFKKMAADGGGNLTGDEKSGSFSGDRVYGNYKVDRPNTAITITDKPFIYPMSAVENTIRKAIEE